MESGTTDCDHASSPPQHEVFRLFLLASLALRTVLDLARTERLSAYDASYLELAMRRGVPLATKDDAMAQAARRVGFSLLPTA